MGLAWQDVLLRSAAGWQRNDGLVQDFERDKTSDQKRSLQRALSASCPRSVGRSMHLSVEACRLALDGSIPWRIGLPTCCASGS